MVYVENRCVPAQPTGSIEGQPGVGTFFVKPLTRGEQMALLEVRVRAGATSAAHAHSHESLICVVSGKLSTTIGSETFVLGPGDVCRHAALVAHRIEALEDTTFVEIKSPPPDLHETLGPNAILPPGWSAVHRTAFDDIDPVGYPDDYGTMRAISDEQALAIARFVVATSQTCPTLIVHCRYGISRSAAIAKAVAQTFRLPFPADYDEANEFVYGATERSAGRCSR